MALYKDYFKISEDYVSCMTREAINHNPRTWMQFYPHLTFVKFLRDILESMNGGNKSVWLTGAYGTGKSHAALVLQKLFMDDESRVREWFEKRANQFGDKTLENEVFNQRSKGVLVVFETKSDGLTTPEQFLVRIENAIISSLREGNYKIPVVGSVDKILERVSEEGENFFKKRDEIQDKLTVLTPDIKNFTQLKNEMVKPNLTTTLLSDVMTVLHARDIYINLTTSNLLAWVNEILKVNNLSRLLFIWDEFSGYIDQNRSQLKTFEEIAEAAQEGKFFFIPVTHMRLESYLAAGSESAKKANGRFKFDDIDIPTNTALVLAADNAFKIIDKNGWEDERAKLWHDISDVVTYYMAPRDSECKESPECFKGILPIHPMAAFMLKSLSKVVGSNQRSMFNFLRGEVGESEFQTFINTSGPDTIGKQFLTVDKLWHYFVETKELGIASEVNEVRIQYYRFETDLNEADRRVFKAVLLYSLLEKLTGDAGHKLLQPTVENIVRCFEGDSNVVGVENILKELEKKHCFSIVNGRCGMFYSSGNNEDVGKEINKLEIQFHEQFVTLKIQPRLESKAKTFKDKLHYEVRSASVDKAQITAQRTKELFSETGNKILLQFIVARDGDEQLRVDEKAKELATHWKGFRMLFITFPDLNFCSAKKTNWKEYVEQLAHYQLAVDQSTKINYETQLKLMADSWLTKLSSPMQKIKIYQPNADGVPYVETRQMQGLEQYLKTYIKKEFECFVDELSGYNLTAMAELGKGFAAWAETGIDFSLAKGATQTVVKTFKTASISDQAEWFVQNPSHPLTKMRDYCKKRLNNALDGTGQCSIRKIYIDLQRPPYGLLSVPFSAFVMGFVMKEWLNNPRQQLQWTNGSLSDKLDRTTLAEIIESVLKADGSPIKNEKLICRISREEKKFIESAPIMFGIEHIPNATVENTLDSIARRLERISNKAPLWVLPSYISSCGEIRVSDCKEIITHLCAAQKISAKGNQKERTDHIKAIGSLLQSTDGLAELLNRYFTPECFDRAFEQYVDGRKSEISALAAEVGDKTKAYCISIKDHFAEKASWLWDENNVDDELDVVCDKYKIIKIAQRILKSAAFMSYNDALSRIKKAIFKENKISVQILIDSYPFLRGFISALEAENVADGYARLAAQMSANQSEIESIFFNPIHSVQIEILRKYFAEQLSKFNAEEVKAVYSELTSGAKLSAEDFLDIAGQNIGNYLKNSLAQQMIAMWKEKTNSSSAYSWSEANRLPSCLLFEEGANANQTIAVLNYPNDYQAEVLEKTCAIVRDLRIPSIATLEKRFLNLVLPSRYESLYINVGELTKHFAQSLGHHPDEWLLNQAKLSSVIDAFVKAQYDTSYRSKAVAKVEKMTETKAKEILLKMVSKNPDVGFDVLG